MDQEKLTEIEKEALKVVTAYATSPNSKPVDIILLYSNLVREILQRRKTDGSA